MDLQSPRIVAGKTRRYAPAHADEFLAGLPRLDHLTRFLPRCAVPRPET